MWRMPPLIDPSAYQEMWSRNPLKAKLTAEQYQVTQEAIWTSCPQCLRSDLEEGDSWIPRLGSPFFAKDKFASGCGRGQVSRPIAKDVVYYQTMEWSGSKFVPASMPISAMFTDGPKDQGISLLHQFGLLRFIQKEEMEAAAGLLKVWNKRAFSSRSKNSS